MKKVPFSPIERQSGLIFSEIEEEQQSEIKNGKSSVLYWCACGRCREVIELIEQVSFKRRYEDCVSTLPVSFISLKVALDKVNIAA